MDNNKARQLAQQFLSALSANDVNEYKSLMYEDATMRVYGWNKMEAYRPSDHIVQRLRDEWSAWPDPSLETLSILVEQNRAAIEFRIQATEGERYVEHIRSAFLTFEENQIKTIELYCPEPIPSARRERWFAPATVSEAELEQILISNQYLVDVREHIPYNLSGYVSARGVHLLFGLAHPGSNFVRGVHWSEAEADAKIKEMIAYHQEREIGFSWFVSPYDSPADLGERLERHGLVLAGDQAIMLRVGLDDLDIPSNPKVEFEILDGSNDVNIETSLQIVATCFQWTKEQIAGRRSSFFERIKNSALRGKIIDYLIYLEGVPVAIARSDVRGSIVHLGGAATLPDYRGQRVYSSSLKRRLEDAREFGYQIASIDAQPMSRRIVKRYGFKERAKTYVYAWMPVIDMDVIASLVQAD